MKAIIYVKQTAVEVHLYKGRDEQLFQSYVFENKPDNGNGIDISHEVDFDNGFIVVNMNVRYPQGQGPSKIKEVFGMAANDVVIVSLEGMDSGMKLVDDEDDEKEEWEW